jgi:hypothetical protein
VLAVAVNVTPIGAETLCGPSAGIVIGFVVRVKHGGVVQVIVAGTDARLIEGAGSLPDPWFSMQKNCVCDPPEVMLHGTVFENGVVRPYAAFPTAGQAVGAAVNVATPIAVPETMVTWFVTVNDVSA